MIISRCSKVMRTFHGSCLAGVHSGPTTGPNTSVAGYLTGRIIQAEEKPHVAKLERGDRHRVVVGRRRRAPRRRRSRRPESRRPSGSSTPSSGASRTSSSTSFSATTIRFSRRWRRPASTCRSGPSCPRIMAMAVPTGRSPSSSSSRPSGPPRRPKRRSSASSIPTARSWQKEEQRRFELLVAHWDVPLNRIDLGTRKPSR